MYELNLKITGFNCEACVKLSTNVIKKIDGIESVEISQDGTARVISGEEISKEDVANALSPLGFKVKE